MLSEFHEKFGCTISQEILETRIRLLDEEYLEYQEAEMSGDLIKIADALGDMTYVIFGTALIHGINLDTVLEEIHRSNMTKEPALTEGGKVYKGDNYSPPDLEKIIYGN